MTFPAMDMEGDIWLNDDDLLVRYLHTSISYTECVRYDYRPLPVQLPVVGYLAALDLPREHGTYIWQ